MCSLYEMTPVTRVTGSNEHDEDMTLRFLRYGSRVLTEHRPCSIPISFAVNEAWIALLLNEAPLHAGLNGSFNCLALPCAAKSLLHLNVRHNMSVNTDPHLQEAASPQGLRCGYFQRYIAEAAEAAI